MDPEKKFHNLMCTQWNWLISSAHCGSDRWKFFNVLVRQCFWWVYTLFDSVLMSIFQLTCITNNGSSTTNIRPKCTIEIYSSVGWWWIKERNGIHQAHSTLALAHASATIQNERFVEHRRVTFKHRTWFILRAFPLCVWIRMERVCTVYATQYKLCWVLASG